MSDTLKLINAAKLLSDTQDHIIRAGHLLKLSEAMRAYLEAMNKKPAKPTMRVSKSATEFLQSYLQEPVTLWFSVDKFYVGNSNSLKFTFPKYKDGDDVTYYVRMDGNYVVDIPYSMMGHAQWGHIQTELEKRVDDIPARAMEFNILLRRLRHLSDFALPEDRLHPLYPLSQAFGWYELRQI